MPENHVPIDMPLRWFALNFHRLSSLKSEVVAQTLNLPAMQET